MKRGALRFGVLDIGTAKTVALVLEGVPGWSVKVLGYGQAATRGVERGQVVDMPALIRTVTRAMNRARRMAKVGDGPLPIWSNLAARPVQALTHRGAVGLPNNMVEEEDVLRAEEAARAVPIEHNQAVLHIIRRGFFLDDKPVHWPVGMYGYRLEAEVHIITVPRTDLLNLKQALEDAGLLVEAFVLNPLAVGEAVLSDTEREMGVIVCDIGAGTTDVAVYAGHEVDFATVLPLGGNDLTRDLAQILSLPWQEAERLKVEHGHASPDAVQEDQWLTIHPFGEGEAVRIRARDVAAILEARIRDIFQKVARAVREAGKWGMFPAGLVLTGGTSHLPGLRQLLARELKMPVRIARLHPNLTWPQAMSGPEYATALGVVYFAQAYLEHGQGTARVPAAASGDFWSRVKAFLRGLLP